MKTQQQIYNLSVSLQLKYVEVISLVDCMWPVFNQNGDVIEEILVAVLRRLPRRRLLSLCFVCRAWRAIVQPVLWEDVDCGFVKMLSPTVLGSGPGRFLVRPPCSISTLSLTFVVFLVKHFNYDPTPQEWRYFCEKTKYAQVFRDLSFGGSQTQLSPAAIASIARSRPLKPIFPSLRVFHMTSLGTRKLFMSPTVVEFAWRIDTAIITSEMTRICYEIVDEMPYLETIRIEGADIPHVELDLLWLFHHLHSLRRITLPLYALTSTLFHGLSSISTLVAIDFDRTLRDRVASADPPSTAYIDTFSIASMSFPDNSFPSLTHLELGLPNIEALMDILEASVINLSSLERLVIRIPTPDLGIGGKVNVLLEMLAACALSLTELGLYLAPSRQEDLEVTTMCSAVGLCDLEPVGKITYLDSFTIHLGTPLGFTNDDMEDLAVLLPNIKKLVLNPHPSLRTVPLATFASLSSFARWCPHLRELALCLNGKIDFSWRVQPPFGPDFKILRLGRTRLPGLSDRAHRQQVAMCVGDLLPRSAGVTCVCPDDVLDCADYELTESMMGKRTVWSFWNISFGLNWADIWMTVQAVAEERARPSGEREYIEAALMDVQGYVPYLS